MAQGQVQIDEVNLFQGELPTVEKKMLFIGVAPNHQNTWQYVNAQTDLDALLGSADSDLKTQLIAARQNAGQQWSTYVIPKAADTTCSEAATAVIFAMDHLIDFEGLVLCDAAENAEDAGFSAVQGLLSYMENFGSFPFALVALPGIDPDTQKWSDYKTAMNTLVSSVADERLIAVPNLHGNNIGVLAGRLCRHDTSIADSPMRVATGALVGIGATPVDSDDKKLKNFDMKDLDDQRLSCPQDYIGYPGMYWGDANTLAAPGSDFAVLENLRVVRKAQRAVRLLMIARVADRKLNNTPASIASNKQYFSRPLQRMAKGFVFSGVTFPGDIKPPADDSIEIVWLSHTEVDIYIKVQPYESPKKLTAHIALDLSSGVSVFS